AISSRGSQARAMAIRARCRMPPDSWWAYSFSRRPGSGMPTLSSMTRACSMASDLFASLCRMITSATWMPRGTTGFSDDSGSWKIIARSRPRRSRSSSPDMVSNCSPANVALPSTLLPRAGSSPMIASDVTDLPQPDSPTSPTVWPAATSKLTPSTARNSLRPLPKVTVRSRTDRSGVPLEPASEPAVVMGWAVMASSSATGLGVEGLAQRLAHEGEAERDDDDADRRVDGDLGMGVEVLLSPTEHLAPLGLRVVRVAQSQEGQGG